MQPTRLDIRKQARIAGLSLAFWLAMVGVFSTAAYIDGVRHGLTRDLLQVVAAYAAGFAPWLILTAVVFIVARRHARTEPTALGVCLHALAMLLVSYIVIGVFVVTVHWIQVRVYGSSTFGQVGVVAWLWDTLVFGIVYMTGRSFGHNDLRIAEMLSRLQLEKDHAMARAEIAGLEANELRHRFSSHFLQNAFANVLGMLRARDYDAAGNAIMLLSSILRDVTSGESGQNLVAVADEVAFVEKYIEFQRIRFPSAVIGIHVGDDVKEFGIPHHFLQPLVENAFKHGMRTNGELVVDVNIKAVDGRVVVNVANTVPGKATGDADTGEGLALTELRLKRSFGRDYDVKRSSANGRYVFAASFPARPLQ